MNKEILRKNIEQVIMQPCNSKYPTEIKPNGLSEDGTYIMVKTTCDDSSSQIRLKWCNNGVYEDIDFVEEIMLKPLCNALKIKLLMVLHY